MATYSPLFRLKIEHSYFSDGLCPALKLVPTPGTAKIIGNSGLVAKNVRHEFHVFFDATKTDILRSFAADSGVPFSLVFEAISNDPLFGNYTETRVNKSGSILYFESQGTSADADGRYRLHSEESVGEIDFRETDSALPLSESGCVDGHFARVFVLNINISERDVDALIAHSASAVKDYFIKFQGRRSIWKYYLLGDLANEKFYVDDRDKQIEFISSGEITLPNERVAQSFRSRTPLPLFDRSKFHFQLKDGNSGGSKVLIKRLPVASPSQVSKEIIDGSETLVSEMFINR